MCTKSTTSANTAAKFFNHSSPQAPQSLLFPEQLRQFPQPFLVHLIKPSHFRTINICNRNHQASSAQPTNHSFPLPPIPTDLPTLAKNRHHDLAPALQIASYILQKHTNVRDHHDPLLCSRSRHALAGQAAAEETKNENRRPSAVERVEAKPRRRAPEEIHRGVREGRRSWLCR